MSSERWLPAPGMLGDYEISNAGNLRRITPTKYRKDVPYTVKPGAHGRYGHLCVVKPGESGRKEKFYIHRLVALAFIGEPPEGKTQVRHIDGNAANNFVDNLSWSTHAENNIDIVNMGRSFNGTKTHCKRGHELTTENTAHYPRNRGINGERVCKTCGREDRQRGLPKNSDRHGTISGYNKFGCRCEDCKRAKSDQAKRLALNVRVL